MYKPCDQNENCLKPDVVSLVKCCGPCKRESGLWNLCGVTFELKSYWIINIVASLLHLFNAVLMIILFYQNGEKDVCYHLTMPYASWQDLPSNQTGNEEPEFIIVQRTVDTHTLSLHWLIVGFFLLSFFFQFIVVLIDEDSPCRIKQCGRIKYPYIEGVEQYGVNPLRFVEYSISASIMLVAIGLLTGIRNENELIMIAISCGVCQYFGMIAELTTDYTIRFISHIMGYVCILTSYGIIWNYYGIANYKGSQLDPPRSAPDVVHVVVTLLFVLFNLFGLVQTCQMCCKQSERFKFFYNWIGSEAELSYVVLSLASKTLLGWLIYSNVLVMAVKC